MGACWQYANQVSWLLCVCVWPCMDMGQFHPTLGHPSPETSRNDRIKWPHFHPIHDSDGPNHGVWDFANPKLQSTPTAAEVYRSAHVKMLQFWILDINTFISSYVYIHEYTSHYAYLCELISPHWGFVQAACVIYIYIYIHTDIHTYIFICHMYVYIIYNCIMSYHMYHLSIVLRVQGVPGKAVICTLMQYPI